MVKQTMATFPDRPASNEKLYRTLDLINDQEAERTYVVGDYYRRTGKVPSAEFYFGQSPCAGPRASGRASPDRTSPHSPRCPASESRPQQDHDPAGQPRPLDPMAASGMGGMAAWASMGHGRHGRHGRHRHELSTRIGEVAWEAGRLPLVDPQPLNRPPGILPPGGSESHVGWVETSSMAPAFEPTWPRSCTVPREEGRSDTFPRSTRGLRPTLATTLRNALRIRIKGAIRGAGLISSRRLGPSPALRAPSPGGRGSEWIPTFGPFGGSTSLLGWRPMPISRIRRMRAWALVMATVLAGPAAAATPSVPRSIRPSGPSTCRSSARSPSAAT